MELENIGSLLGMKAPWFVTDVHVQPTNLVVDVHISYERGSVFPCPCCGKKVPVYDSSVKRIRYLDLFDYRCYLNIKSPRLNCPRDGVISACVDPWSRKGSHFSLKFEALLMRLIKEMSVFAVAQEVGESDSTIWRTFHYTVKNKIIPKFDFSNVKRVCVDETAIKRGHNYISIFTDYDTGQVLYVTQGRKKEVFSEFYGWLWDHNGFPGNIELFSMDMSRSYIAGQQAYFANCEVVFDRFHIKKYINKAVDKVRKQEVKQVDDLKNTKYIWLKNEQNLNSGQKIQLNNFLFDSSLNTAKAYKIKIEFDMLWNVPRLAVLPLLDVWIKRARALELTPISNVVDTIIRHSKGVLNSMFTRVTNAVAEGLNSVMQLARSRARGYRNPESFCSMVYFLGGQ